MRRTTRPEIAARIFESFGDIDVRDRLAHVKVPTLVIHARGDERVPFDEGRAIAASIPQAQFLALESRNHVLLESEPAWLRFQNAIRDFLGTSTSPTTERQGEAHSVFATLTARELEILTQVATGEGNSQIAGHLSISEKTVRNHLTAIFDKLGVTSRSQAIVLARERGLLGEGR
jgi:DNA-binding NarL/FixJ family response regulator